MFYFFLDINPAKVTAKSCGCNQSNGQICCGSCDDYVQDDSSPMELPAAATTTTTA